MSLRASIVTQFRQPQGPLGHVAGWIMATRHSNIARNRWTIDLLDIQPNDHALEIGCGPGVALAQCLARIDRGTIVGLDHSAVMIEQARRRNRSAIEHGRLQLRLGGLECLENFLAHFDKVYSSNVAQFFPDKAAAFGLLAAAMSPGGTIATTHQPRTAKASDADALKMAETLSHVLDSVGFVAIRTEILRIKPVAAVCVLARKPAATSG